MAFRKFRRFKRRVNKTLARYPNAANAARVATVALNTAMAVKRLVNVETKVFSHTGDIVPTNNGNTNTYCLNDMLQGDSDSNRNGDSVKMKGLTIKELIYPHPTATANGQVVRTTVWMEKQPNGVYADYGELNDNNNTVNAPIGVKGHDRRFTTKILYDKVITLEGDGKPVFLHKYIHIPSKYQHVQYIGATTNIATNKLNITWCADISGCTLTPNIRLSYIDN